MQCTFFLDIVISKRFAVINLFACKKQSLLYRRNPRFFLYLSLNSFYRIGWFYLDGICSLGVDWFHIYFHCKCRHRKREYQHHCENKGANFLHKRIILSNRFYFVILTVIVPTLVKSVMVLLGVPLSLRAAVT